jgi:hypothetical protein
MLVLAAYVNFLLSQWMYQNCPYYCINKVKKKMWFIL